MDKRVDAAIPGAPLPAWRWLVWFRPLFGSTPNLVGGPEYLVYGSDDREDAEARATYNPDYYVRENPVWRTLN